MQKQIFIDRLNNCLDEIDMPKATDERCLALAKLMHISHFKATTILNGNAISDPKLLEQLAQELEVTTTWLVGEES